MCMIFDFIRNLGTKQTVKCYINLCVSSLSSAKNDNFMIDIGTKSSTLTGSTVFLLDI